MQRNSFRYLHLCWRPIQPRCRRCLIRSQAQIDVIPTEYVYFLAVDSLDGEICEGLVESLGKQPKRRAELGGAL
jgi:hypothetical protein